MKIIGTFNVEMPKDTLRNMKAATNGYIFCLNIILSKAHVCIPLDTEVFYNIQQIKELNYGAFIGVRKINNKNDNTSFILNLKVDPALDLKNWNIQPSFATSAYLHSRDWICISNPPITYIPTSSIEDLEYLEEIPEDEMEFTMPVLISNMSIQELEEKLEQTVAQENYELAVKIRDEIARKKENE